MPRIGCLNRIDRKSAYRLDRKLFYRHPGEVIGRRVSLHFTLGRGGGWAASFPRSPGRGNDTIIDGSARPGFLRRSELVTDSAIRGREDPVGSVEYSRRSGVDIGRPYGHGPYVSAGALGLISQGDENHIRVEGMQTLDAHEDESFGSHCLVDRVEGRLCRQSDFHDIEAHSGRKPLEALAANPEGYTDFDSRAGSSHGFRHGKYWPRSEPQALRLIHCLSRLSPDSFFGHPLVDPFVTI